MLFLNFIMNHSPNSIYIMHTSQNSTETYLHSRITKGWEGKKTAILGGLGFFVIWICYLGVNFLGKGLHSYGWLS